MSDYTGSSQQGPAPGGWTPATPQPPVAAEPARRKWSRMWIPIIGIAVVVVGLGGFGIATITKAHTDITHLQREVSQLTTQMQGAQATAQRDDSLIQEQSSQISSLSNTVSGLSQPSDPLSAYNQICTAQATNSTTGITQTYYYPCTNQATTTPQPGA